VWDNAATALQRIDLADRLLPRATVLARVEWRAPDG
jgi:hypothetical protein